MTQDGEPLPTFPEILSKDKPAVINDPKLLIEQGWKDTGNWQNAYQQAIKYSGSFKGVRILPGYDSDGNPLPQMQRILIKASLLPGETTDIKVEFPHRFKQEYERVIAELANRSVTGVDSIHPLPDDRWYRGTSLAWIIYGAYLDSGLIRSYYYDGTILSDNITQSVLYANDFLRLDKIQKDKLVLENLGLPSLELTSGIWQPVVLGFQPDIQITRKELAYTSLGPLHLSQASTRTKTELIDRLKLNPQDYMHKIIYPPDKP